MPMTSPAAPAVPSPLESYARLAELARLLVPAREAARTAEALPRAQSLEASTRIGCFLADHLQPAVEAGRALPVGPAGTLPDVVHDPAAFFAALADLLGRIRGDLQESLAALDGAGNDDPDSPATDIRCVLAHLPEAEIEKLREPIASALDLSVDTPATRSRLAHLVACDHFAGSVPAAAQLEIHVLHGRFFAAWLHRADAGHDADRWELFLLAENPRQPGTLVYSEC